jgi:hypothetical protein
MERLATRRCTRRIVAALLLLMAIIAVIVEPLPKGFVLIPITDEHGIDAGDLPAIGLILSAAWLFASGGTRRDHDE